MSNKAQTSKNIELTHKFISYLLMAKSIPNLPKEISFVPFSKLDNKLNLANEELLESLTNEGSPVARVEEPKVNNGNWKIIPVNF
jgi:hypothetical protein